MSLETDIAGAADYLDGQIGSSGKDRAIREADQPDGHFYFILYNRVTYLVPIGEQSRTKVADLNRLGWPHFKASVYNHSAGSADSPVYACYQITEENIDFFEESLGFDIPLSYDDNIDEIRD